MTNFDWQQFDWQQRPTEIHGVDGGIVYLMDDQPFRVITDHNGAMVAVEYVNEYENSWDDPVTDVVRVPVQQIVKLVYRVREGPLAGVAGG